MILSLFFGCGIRLGEMKSLRRKNIIKKMLWLERNGFQLVEIMEDETDYISRKFFLDKAYAAGKVNAKFTVVPRNV